MPRPKIELKSFNDMFALHGEDERARGEARAANASDESRNSGLTSVHGNRESLQIPLVQLHPFAHHPFKRYSGAKMAEMVKSVKEHGIITPILVRRREEGGWEIISGHNRVEAARLAGLKTIPAYPRDADDNAAAIMMVDSNFHQREKILPSELAFAYKLKLEAIKRQGERNDLTSRQIGTKLPGGRSDAAIAETADESARSIQRYIRLTELIQPLLDKVDSNKLGFVPAVLLSYLSKKEQEALNETLDARVKKLTVRQAEALKQRSQEGTLDERAMLNILDEKREDAVKEVKIKYGQIRRYFSPTATLEEIEERIVKALEVLRKVEARI